MDRAEHTKPNVQRMNGCDDCEAARDGANPSRSTPVLRGPLFTRSGRIKAEHISFQCFPHVV